jgi:hypothetical protein
MTSKFPSRYRQNAKKNAIRFLQGLLRTGPVGSRAVIDEALKVGFNAKTLQRAKKEIGIKSKKDSTFAGGWVWMMPPREDGHAAKIASQNVHAAKMDNEDGKAETNVDLRRDAENKPVLMHILPEDGQTSASVHLRKPSASWLLGKCPNCGKEKYVTKACGDCEASCKRTRDGA